MGTIIIILILAVILVVAILSSAKHFKGEGGCCGGSSDGPVRSEKKVLEHPAIAEVTLSVEGMHCENCKGRVENALNALEGVSAQVDLKKKVAIVTMDRAVPDGKLRAAVGNMGYEVTDLVRREL